PSIKTDRFGRAFVIGPTGSGCPAMRVTHDGSAAKFIGFPDHSTGGGDCDWAIGQQETGAPRPTFGASSDDNLAYSSLDNLVTFTVGKSNNGGDTFGPPNVLATQLVGNDRQWMAAAPQLNSTGHDTVYMTYHDVSLVNIEMSISVDGGQTYVQSGPVITDLLPDQYSG